jgi:hypothetical protein
LVLIQKKKSSPLVYFIFPNLVIISSFRIWFVHDFNSIQTILVARLSGSRMDAMEELDSEDKGVLNQIKCWFFSHTQHLNFFTILVLASVSIHFMLHSFQYDLVFFFNQFICK